MKPAAPALKRSKAIKSNPVTPGKKNMPRFNHDLNPELLAFRPDFGFPDDLNNAYFDRSFNLWKMLYDHTKNRPQFERISNLIHWLTMDKYYAIIGQMEQDKQS